MDELWRYRDLFLTMAWRDFSVRYKQTALGVLWAVFQPLITMLIFTFIFNRVAKVESGDGTPYPIFVYFGLIVWQYFAGTLSKASESMVVNQAMIQKVYFPRVILPAASAITSFADMCFSGVILMGMLIYYHQAIVLTRLLVLPILLITLMLCSMGIGLFLSALNVKYRDVRHALPFLIQTAMYCTPVVYPAQVFNGYPIAKELMLWLNPVSGIITNLRTALLSQAGTNWASVGICLLASIIYFEIGLNYFKSTEKFFSDVI